MARFILDVANCDKAQVEDVMKKVMLKLVDKVATIRVVDMSNDGQFHEDEIDNVLTEEQIDNFNQKKSVI